MNLIDKIIPKGKEEYKCYDLIKSLIINNKDFALKLEDGFNNGNIKCMDNEFLEKFNTLNVRWPVKDIDEVFLLGGNIGGCTTMAYELSFLFDNPFKCAGILDILKGTKNSPDGRHTWVEADGWIYDTSLMLIIKKDYVNIIGYKENIRELYNNLKFYDMRREFALDKTIRRSK